MLTVNWKIVYFLRQKTANPKKDEMVTHRSDEQTDRVEVEECNVVKSIDSTSTFTVESIEGPAHKSTIFLVYSNCSKIKCLK